MSTTPTPGRAVDRTEVPVDTMRLENLRLIGERDRARDLVVALEQELAACQDRLAAWEHAGEVSNMAAASWSNGPVVNDPRAYVGEGGG